MRTSFVAKLEELMSKDDNITLLTGDMGFSVFEGIRDKYETRFLNMGLAEQNMMGVAAGMAKAGLTPFVYSIIPFVVFRPFEQIRNDICFQNLPVRIVGVGAGFAYGDQGYSHHSVEDYGILLSLPNITIFSPADPKEVSALMDHMSEIKGPVYLRLSKKGEPVLHEKHNEIKVGKALKIREGKDVLIISTGSLVKLALDVAADLEKSNISCTVLDYHTIKPFDEEALLTESSHKKVIVTIEEHSITTGLFSLVSQALKRDKMSSPQIVPFGVKNLYEHKVGTRDYLLKLNGIEHNGIVNMIIGHLNGQR